MNFPKKEKGFVDSLIKVYRVNGKDFNPPVIIRTSEYLTLKEETSDRKN